MAYGLDSRDSISGGQEKFCSLQSVETGSGAHPVPYAMGAEGSFPGVKRPGRETEHSPPSSAEDKNS
jgi:hypothetical protein